jgi:predicted transcriptional regulator
MLNMLESKPAMALVGSLFFSAIFAMLVTAVRVASGLDHPTRVRIYQHLVHLPGDHFRSIMRSLRLGLGTARHHIDVLVSTGLVRPERHSRHIRYYPRGDGAHSLRNDLFEKHWTYSDLRTRTLFSLRQMKEGTPTSIANALGISRQLAAYHLARLEEMGLVKRVDHRYRA